MIPKSGHRFSDKIMRNKMIRAALLAIIALLAPQTALAQSCPEPPASARRLVLVTADKFTSTTATVQRFERAAPKAPWQLSGGPATGLIGHKGLAWAQSFRAFARKGEPAAGGGPGEGPDRPQGSGLGAVVSCLRAQRRAGEGGRRQARAGGLL